MVLLKLVWYSLFDDFSKVTRDVLAIETLFDLLGIDSDRDGKKAPPYAPVFNMLGLQIDQSSVRDRKVFVGHTESRCHELAEFQRSVLAKGSIEPRVFERLRGRAVVFDGFSFGRVANSAIRTLSAVAFDRELRSAAQVLIDRVNCAAPLCVQPCSRDTWILFTDGACEPERCWGRIGAVLFSPNRCVAGFFGESVDMQLMQRLLSCSANPTYELEIAPNLVSLELWKGILSGVQLACYLDHKRR